MINIILIFGIHFISDFLLQTRKMGTNKSKSLYWLTAHVFIYSSVTAICWCLFNIDIYTLFSIWVLTFITHWVTDFITSKITTYFYTKNDMFLFFSTIGLDQFIHATTLLLTYNYLIKTI